MADPIELATRSQREHTRETFDERVRAQTEELLAAVERGDFDNPGFGLGIELETYAVDGAYRLARLPDPVFEVGACCARELGLHNAEFNTRATPFTGVGLDEQAAELGQCFADHQQVARENGVEIVFDAMWTVPPPEGTVDYLSAIEDQDGVRVAQNMTESSRYWAIDTEICETAGGEITVPAAGVERSFPSILVESLTSSIQPHLQLPSVDQFGAYHAMAVRTLGPVLALATNSPLLPADLYEVDDPAAILDEAPHELRIHVFERSINQVWDKVRFPPDVETVADSLADLEADETCAPFLWEWLADGDRVTIDDEFWELGHKRGTYWRWLRPVFGGQPVGNGDERSIRLEYRPLPAQPTVVDNVGFVALTAGLIHGLVMSDHPLADLPHEAAEECFYAVVEEGLEADLAWVMADGERTDDPAVVYDELFAIARAGLADRGIDDRTINRYLAPIEARWEQRRTPSQWKLERVRAGLELGLDFEESVEKMQIAYIRQAAEYDTFAEWPAASEDND